MGRGGRYGFFPKTPHTNFHNYSHTYIEKKTPEKLKTLDIGTRLLDNAAFVGIHTVGRFS